MNMRKTPREMINKAVSMLKYRYYQCLYFPVSIHMDGFPSILGQIKVTGRQGSIRFQRHSILHSMRIVLGNTRASGSLSCGRGALIEQNVTLSPRNGIIEIGDAVFIGPNVFVQSYDNCLIRVGDGTLVGKGSTILASNHDISTPGAGYKKEIGKDVIIGKNVWIGSNVIVLAGVEIGDSAVIGAGTIVTHDVPSYTMFLGNPGRATKVFDTRSQSWVVL